MRINIDDAHELLSRDGVERGEFVGAVYSTERYVGLLVLGEDSNDIVVLRIDDDDLEEIGSAGMEGYGWRQIITYPWDRSPLLRLMTFGPIIDEDSGLMVTFTAGATAPSV